MTSKQRRLARAMVTLMPAVVWDQEAIAFRPLDDGELVSGKSIQVSSDSGNALTIGADGGLEVNPTDTSLVYTTPMTEITWNTSGLAATVSDIEVPIAALRGEDSALLWVSVNVVALVTDTSFTYYDTPDATKALRVMFGPPPKTPGKFKGTSIEATVMASTDNSKASSMPRMPPIISYPRNKVLGAVKFVKGTGDKSGMAVLGSPLYIWTDSRFSNVGKPIESVSVGFEIGYHSVSESATLTIS